MIDTHASIRIGGQRHGKTHDTSTIPKLNAGMAVYRKSTVLHMYGVCVWNISQQGVFLEIALSIENAITVSW